MIRWKEEDFKDFLGITELLWTLAEEKDKVFLRIMGGKLENRQFPNVILYV